MPGGSRLSEARRCFAVLAFILLCVTLFGSHLPWMQISEHDHVHKWVITEPTEEGDNTGTATYHMDLYFNLMSVESCQTFLEDSNFFFDGQEVCSVMSFDDADKNTVDVHDWSMYSETCEAAGMTSFALLVLSVSIMVLVVLMATFKNIQRKCCPQSYESQHGKARCIVPSCALLAPVCAILSVILYFVQCIDDAKGKDVVEAEGMEDVQRSAIGYEGFWIALVGSVCMLFWWILFTIWFCNKRVERADFAAGDHQMESAQPIVNLNDSDSN